MEVYKFQAFEYKVLGKIAGSKKDEVIDHIRTRCYNKFVVYTNHLLLLI